MSADHRQIVAAQRREKMRHRLIEAAVLVYAAKPHGEVVIEDIVAEAGVSRGSFYKYYDTLDDLLHEAKLALGREILSMVLEQDRETDDPAVSLARDLRSFMQTCRRYQIIGRFSARMGLGPSDLMDDLIPAYIPGGIASGRFAEVPKWLGINVLKASVLAVQIKDGTTGDCTDADEELAVAAALRSFGISRDEAQALCKLSGQALDAPPGSLIARSEAVRAAAASAATPPRRGGRCFVSRIKRD